MSRVKRIFLTLTIAVPIVLVISYFTKDEDKDLMMADADTVETFITNNVGGEVQMDHFKRLGDSKTFIATYHIPQNDQGKVGFSTFEEVKEGMVKYRKTEFGATSHSFSVLVTENGSFGVLYGIESPWKQARVSFPLAEYTFESPSESPFLLVKELDSSLENPEDYTIHYQE